MEYIEKEALINEFCKRGNNKRGTGYAHFEHGTLNCVENVLSEFEAVINNAPAADVAPVIHAKWYIAEYSKFAYRRAVNYYCSGCLHLDPIMSRYCPYCGALMENGADYMSSMLSSAIALWPSVCPMTDDI